MTERFANYWDVVNRLMPSPYIELSLVTSPAHLASKG
jgi:hypothetical protein